VCRFFFIAESPLQGFHLNGFSHKQWHNFRGEGQFISGEFGSNRVNLPPIERSTRVIQFGNDAFHDRSIRILVLL
jgi:hypothetical protein